MLSSLFWRASARPDAGVTGDDHAYAEQLVSPRGWNPPQFEANTQLRVLLCHDSSVRGKCPLFDTHMKPVRSTSVGGNATTTPPGAARLQSMSSAAAASMPNVSPAAGAKGSRPSPRKQPFHAQSADLDLIGEMMFGAVPLTYRGTTTKIHYLRFPSQLLITKLFSFSPNDFHSSPPAQAPNVNDLTPKADLFGTNGNLAGPIESATSSPPGASDASGRISPSPSALSISGGPRPARGMISPSPKARRIQTATSPMSLSPTSSMTDTYDAGAELTASPLSTSELREDEPRPRAPSNASDLSIPASQSYNARRYMRYRSTSIENGTFNPSPLPTSASSSFREHSSSISTPQHQQRLRRLQFALGIVVNVDTNRQLRDLIFSHFALIEFRVHKMYDAIALAVRDAMRLALPPHLVNALDANITADDLHHHLLPFILQGNPQIAAAVTEFRASLRTLYLMPRIHEPLWLNLVTFPARRPFLAKALMKELVFLFDVFESKKQVNFLATVLTAVLSNHLAWVPTVAPPPPGSDDSNELPINRYFTYNPLWAQLSDLYGSIGSPAQLARTIVVGTNTSWVNRLLYVLTYFIRCSEIFESTEQLDNGSQRSARSKRNSDDLEKDSGHGEPAPSSPADAYEHEDPAINVVSLLDSFRLGESAYTSPSVTVTNSNADAHHKETTAAAIADGRSRGSSRTTDEGVARSRRNSTMEELSSSLGSPRSSLTFSSSPTNRAPSPFALLPAKAPNDPTPQVLSAHRQAFGAVLGEEQYDGIREIPMPLSQTVRMFPNVAAITAAGPANYRSEHMFAKTYGRSLLAGYAQRYASDFVLLGLPHLDFMEALISDLKLSVVHRVVDEPVFRSVCIIADTNEWRCEQITSSTEEMVEIDPDTLTPRRVGNGDAHDTVSITHRQPQASEFITATLTSLRALVDLGMSAEACVMHLEDRLQELYFKSILLSEFVNEHSDQSLTYRTVSTRLGLAMSDLPLLVATASTHHPNIALRFKISEQLLMVRSRDQ